MIMRVTLIDRLDLSGWMHRNFRKVVPNDDLDSGGGG